MRHSNDMVHHLSGADCVGRLLAAVRLVKVDMICREHIVTSHDVAHTSSCTVLLHFVRLYQAVAGCEHMHALVASICS